MRKMHFLHFILVIVLICILGGARPSFAAEHPAPGMDTLEEILSDVQLLHISVPDNQTLVKGAIEGLIETLDDPYTNYLTPEELREFRNTIDGNYVGIGVQMQPGKIYPQVLNTIENTPAGKAGIRPGDWIIKIDGVDISNELLGQVVEKIRGPAGTKLTLTIRRDGAADFDIILTRAGVTTPTVSGDVLNGNVGYIYISMFGDLTGDEFKKILGKLIERGASKLILDLRDNPGGIIHPALSVGGNFIEPGNVVVSICDNLGNREEYLAERLDGQDMPIIKDMPVAVLVNEYTSSAAELVAGALQDYGLATLIGGQTFGKGTVQAVIPLETGGALKITVARYFTPRDRAIDGTGLKPDVQVLTPDLSPAVAYAYLNGDEDYTIVFDRDRDEVVVNGILIGNERIIQLQNKIYLPLRLLLESLGYKVDWLPGEGVVQVVRSQSAASFYPGGDYYIVNGQTYPATAEVLSIEGHMYIQESLLPFFKAMIRHEGNTVIIEKK